MLGDDHGKYSFRQWQTVASLPAKGVNLVQVRCTNANGAMQPLRANWNPAGFMRNVIEEVSVVGT